MLSGVVGRDGSPVVLGQLMSELVKKGQAKNSLSLGQALHSLAGVLNLDWGAPDNGGFRISRGLCLSVLHLKNLELKSYS